MWGVALKLLKAEWRSLIVVLVLTGAGVWFGTFLTEKQLSEQVLAFSQEKARLNSDFNAQKTLWDKERLAAADQYAADLNAALEAQNAWHQKADELTRTLAAKEQQHQQTATNLQKRLNDAIARDGSTYTGLGPHSLQLWREALGYPEAKGINAGNGMSETTGGHAAYPTDAYGSGGGLSPAGIVSHSAEYGKWCLVLRDRLQALNDYYNR
ncbi:hypothetical protein NLN82_22730 [Citrobacter portucalensis]|uniref:hypothetical protein n=1 Tax=Citrobacter portucalensis TaxID=1639133 RepID=UPI00226B35AD|nr:hypothetical protein [Citrobacter portucalensis]MCX9038843.1 hypothetical protein [Citrobacter portucalensis]